MKKHVILALILMAIFAISCAVQRPIKPVEPEMTLEEAIAIAQGTECTEKGILTDKTMYNENTKTWWIDLQMKPEFAKEICNPACVIFVETKTVEINWRCAGAIPPPEDFITDLSCDAKNPCPEGLECYKFPDRPGPVCAQPDPCSYYCEAGTECVMLESYPMQIRCV